MPNWTQLILTLIVGIAIGAGGYALLSRPAVVPAPTEAPVAAQEAKAPAVPSEAAPPKPVLPEIPISLNYIEASTGRGYVVQFHNQSQKHLAVLVELENKTLNQKKSGPLQLAPGQLIEIGGTPEWTFVSGETVTLKLDGYRTKSFQIP